MGRFINADVDVATGHGLLGNNMFAYCGNNPVNNTDSSGEDWWHWAVAAVAVVAAAAAVVVTAGCATAAIITLTCVANGVSTCGTAATVAAGVFISSATALATNTYMAASESSSLEEFAAHGEAAMYSTIVSGVYGGAVAYGMSRTQSPTECFVAGTLVKTADGNRPIEEIAAGDYVWAWDEATGDVALKEVIETYVNETSELIHLFVNGEEIITTPTHPFYAPIKGWTDAALLRAGDILVLVNGEYVVVEKVQHEILESPVIVYNFNVEDYHTYYVTGGVLVHNKCLVDKNGVRVTVNTSNEHGVPHTHVSDGKVNTTVGLDQNPMPGHPAITKKMRPVILEFWEVIIDGINKFFPPTY